MMFLNFKKSEKLARALKFFMHNLEVISYRKCANENFLSLIVSIWQPRKHGTVELTGQILNPP